ncbi:cation:proton antiporter [Subtercola sp. PAMC28395]|uniref:cation:proton antiporter n=1 Tax=Subtercola sp. PAMC28395 TaxID=2846775 RepID=UPI001C0C4494|nr:cation:proton antiporter [Subtercola sp. PAMC28395]QWT24144.1 cation:proton antiporter [Subtercola sp. PAMC28395]
MSFTVLALVVLVGLLGPLLAARSSWRIPVVVGELTGGLIIGLSGFNLVDPSSIDFHLLATIGFGLTMVIVGSQIPVADAAVRALVPKGLLGAAAVGVAAAALGVAIAALFGTGHAALYAVVLASSSAALVLPMLQSVGMRRSSVTQLVAQIAIADVACIVVLPLVVAPDRAPEAAIGALVIAAAAIVLVVVLRRLSHTDLRRRLHRFSERRRFALELRFSLLALFTFAAIAQFATLSIMLAGFAFGLVLAAGGEPRRLARQLFGITEGFFGPLFFVWLGASLDLRTLAGHPQMILLGAALGLSAVVAHLASRVARLPWSQSVASAGQLGVPVAAVTLALQSGSLAAGEDAAIILGALVTIATSALATSSIARKLVTRTGPTVGR